MKNLLIKRAKIQDTSNASRKDDQPKPAKVIISINSKAPTSTSPEIPILSVLSKVPETGIQASAVIKEVSMKWFEGLDENDRKSKYPSSKRRIVESIIKFSKKNLVMKDEVYPLNEGVPLGVWRITKKGMERLAREKDGWTPRYRIHEAIFEEKS
jgi:hypothetical protein